MKKLSKAALTAALLTAAPSYGAIVLKGDFVNGTANIGGTTTPTLVITQDIVFNIPSNAFASILVFRNWAPTDGGITQLFDTPAQNLAVSNNGNDSLLAINGLYDHNNSLQNDVGINDGLLYLNANFVLAAGTATIKAGSYTFNSSTDFNPALNGLTFNGQVFLADSASSILSNIVTVPEVSSVALLGLGALALGLKRRR